jgi:hypothetical protein
MLNPKKFLVSLNLKEHSLPDKRPEYVIRLDGMPVEKISQCDIGPHCLEIEFLNKGQNDTMVNENNVIVHDLAVEILQLVVDNTDITHSAKNTAVYTTNAGIEKTYGYMHKNGIIKIDFACPPFYHLRNLQVLHDPS